MNQRTKRKESYLRQIERWWNFLFITRKFDISTSAPAEEVAQRLRVLQQIDPRTFLREQPTVRVETVDLRRSYNFEIKILKINEEGQRHTGVKAVGRVIYSDGYEQTIVRGVVRANLQSLVGLIVTSLMMIAVVVGGLIIYFYARVDTQSMTFGLFLAIWTLIFLSGIGVLRYVYRQYLRDYGSLVGRIRDAISEGGHEYEHVGNMTDLYQTEFTPALHEEIATSNKKGTS